MRKFTVLAALAVPLSLFASSPAGAAEEPAELVKYRQIEMGAIAKHFGATKRIVTGKVDRASDLPLHTRALVDLGVDLELQFPEGTGPDKFKTDALPKIWKDAAGFTAAVKAYQEAAAELHKAAEAHDMKAAEAAWGKMGDACGGCHDGFRKEDE